MGSTFCSGRDEKMIGAKDLKEIVSLLLSS